MGIHSCIASIITLLDGLDILIVAHGLPSKGIRNPASPIDEENLLWQLSELGVTP